MELSAILNDASSTYQQKVPLSPASGASSPIDLINTPRTPMDASPAPSSESQSPEDLGRHRASRKQHVRGISEGWSKGVDPARWNGQARTVNDSRAWKGNAMSWSGVDNMRMPFDSTRPRRQTYVYEPSTEAACRASWYEEAGESRGDAGITRARERLPSVHELCRVFDYGTSYNCQGSIVQVPGSDRYGSTKSTQEGHAYDTDATVSEAGSESSPSPGPGEMIASSPASPSSILSPEWSSFPLSPVNTLQTSPFSGQRLLPTGLSESLSPQSIHFASHLPVARSLHSKPRCAFVPDCNLPAPPRRIVSHYFGRNKKETRAIPESIWVFYCRQHYQRAKYRQRTHVYAQTQMRLVRQTVENLEAWGGVTDFAINLRKRAVLLLKKGEVGPGRAGGVASTSDGLEAGDGSDERWLLPFTGPHKSFAEVYDVIHRVAERARVRQSPAAEFELVPNIKPEYMRKAREGRGEE